MQQEGKKEIKLEQRFLGNTGVLVSELCLGTMTFGVTGSCFCFVTRQTFLIPNSNQKIFCYRQKLFCCFVTARSQCSILPCLFRIFVNNSLFPNITNAEGVNAWGMPVASEETSHALLDRFVEVGGNFIDTADNYDKSEEVIGRWVAKRGADKRKDIILATKVRSPTGTGPNDLGLSRKHILDGVERSLKRLQTDYIDLYQVRTFGEVTCYFG